jgi:NitT/TauT family transport system ATP-binding protein
MSDPILRIQNLGLTFPGEPDPLDVLDDISFEVSPREFVCILGPSGSGKTTLLRTLAGLLSPTGGRIALNDIPLNGPPDGIGYVFQEANLMPWRSVLENITLPLEIQQVPKSDAAALGQELIELVGLEGFGDALPRDLSGGMAQRVAIARALVHDPAVLLLDEPFGALDALTRERMRSELLRIWNVYQKTVLMVTHSINEAIFLADRVIVLSPRPAHVRLDIAINIPRPRAPEMIHTAEFGELAQEIRAAIG